MAVAARPPQPPVGHHFDAYADIDWDSPQMALDPQDPRFELPPDTSPGVTSWYRELPAATRARLGCELVARMTT